MMAATRNQIEDQKEETGIHPAKFVTWLIIVSSVMLFASFTSAYIVRRGEDNWLTFDIPNLFAYSTVIIVLSSIAMQWAYFSAKKDELLQVKISLLITLLLGIAFCICQWYGWEALVANNIHFVGNPSESFFYVISGVHLAHMAGGITFLLIIIVKSFQFKVHKKNLLTINLCATYWHFLGAAWIYLYFFLLLNR
ncbi:MAG: cytochrome c oxidase subunit 3 [Bacteroidota bacterium]